MKNYSLPLLLLLTFAVAVGDFAFRTYNPSFTPEYSVGGLVKPYSLAGAAAPKKHLYLRRSWRLTEAPEYGWLQVLGHDAVEVWVNGRKVGNSRRVGQGRFAGVVADIGSYLHVGRNSIAIHAYQLVLDRPPTVAVAGQCEFAGGSEVSLDDASDWRASDVYDRRGGKFWYEADFEDQHWTAPQIGEPAYWNAQVDFPPRGVTLPRRSQWISPAEAADGAAAMARSFELPANGREGWLRVIANGPYCLAVNGWLVADDRGELAMRKNHRPVERTFDISPLLQSGSNTVSVTVATSGETPRLRADLEATTSDGQRTYVATDGSWQCDAGFSTDWRSPTLNDASEWKHCRPELGYLGVMPRAIRRELGEIRPPVAFWLARGASYVAMIILCGLLGAVGGGVSWFVNRRQSPVHRLLPTSLPYVALLPSTVAAAAASLLTWDLAWTGHDVYQPSLLLGLVVLVLAQWLLLALVALGRIPATSSMGSSLWPASLRLHRAGIAMCWLLVIGVALWLRLRDVLAEPIHHDEVTAVMFTESVLERGFPGGQVHPDLPFGYCATNELSFYPTALCALFFDDQRLVVRLPSVLWSMATLLLIGYVGWRWFNAYVGYVSAVLFALSPHIIGMANFGRYLSQLQFFTLLTMVLTYEAVRGTGPVRVRLLWGAALSFIAMYLSWEGSGIFGVGLALAVLFHRRRHLRDVFACPSVYAASTLVGLVVLAQNAHRVLQQTQRLWYGAGISSLTMKPMWRYPFFDHDFFLVNSSWIRDAFLPMAALAVACVLTVRHRWRFPLRFSIICLVMNAELMSVLLPLRTNRYSYHLSQITILIAAAVGVAGAESLFRLVRDARLPAAYRWYVRAVAVGTLSIGIALASGWFVRTSDLKQFVTSAYDVKQLRCPDWEGPSRYLLEHVRDDDVVISITPHAQNFVLAAIQPDVAQPRTVDYWLESRLILQATISDSRDLPLDRRSGAEMIYSVEQLEQLFSQYDRVWYCTMRHGQSRVNDREVSQFLRENMDVVYEDFGTSVMLRDRNHRPAPVRLEEEQAGQIAAEYFLR